MYFIVSHFTYVFHCIVSHFTLLKCYCVFFSFLGPHTIALDASQGPEEVLGAALQALEVRTCVSVCMYVRVCMSVCECMYE